MSWNGRDFGARTTSSVVGRPGCRTPTTRVPMQRWTTSGAPEGPKPELPWKTQPWCLILSSATIITSPQPVMGCVWRGLQVGHVAALWHWWHGMLSPCSKVTCAAEPRVLQSGRRPCCQGSPCLLNVDSFCSTSVSLQVKPVTLLWL